MDFDLRDAIREASGREWTIVADGAPLTIGRSEGNTIVLADDRVSRQHARLQARGGVLVLVDLESTNGTRVNAREIKGTQELQDGDTLEMGEVRFKVRFEA